MTYEQISDAICELTPDQYPELLDVLDLKMFDTYSEDELDEIGENLYNAGVDTAERCRIRRPDPK
jgi:hypothetical protein